MMVSHLLASQRDPQSGVRGKVSLKAAFSEQKPSACILTYIHSPELSLSYLKLEQGDLCVPLQLSETTRTPCLLKTEEGPPVSFLLSPGQW